MAFPLIPITKGSSSTRFDTSMLDLVNQCHRVRPKKSRRSADGRMGMNYQISFKHETYVGVYY